jgi:hypothetical protein
MDIRFESGYKPIGDGDFDLYRSMTDRRRDQVDQFQKAAWLIRDGVRLAPSIDDFLDQHRTNDVANLYGKAAIVKSILEAERNSRLYFAHPRERLNVEALANTWFVKFMHMLGRNVPKENMSKIFEKVSFIVFNYDRCIEFFLGHALRGLYGVSEGDAFKVVDNLQLIHPYGSAGSLSKVPFGGAANFRESANEIKTYTELPGAGDVITKVRAAVDRAESIVFLGFAYHTQNMLMFKPERTDPRKKIYGTAYQMSGSDVHVVSHQLGEFFSMN